MSDALDEGRVARQGIQVIARAAAILRTLKHSEGTMSLGQIAERVKLPRSTVQRIVGALQEERLIIAAAQPGGLRLGPELAALAEAARPNVVESCHPLLTELARTTGETVDLSTLRGTGMIFLDQVPGSQRLRAVSSVGEVFPLTTTANGRACLALLPPNQAERLAVAEWDRHRVRHASAHLLAELARIRETGLAYDRDEHTIGISAIGIGFKDWQGELHSISVPIPSTRFTAQRAAVEDALHRSKRHIEAMTSPR